MEPTDSASRQDGVSALRLTSVRVDSVDAPAARSLTKAQASALLTSLSCELSSPSFQVKLNDRIQRAQSDSGYDLQEVPGRKELMLAVQREVLPWYGFEGDAEGVSQMWQGLRPHLGDPEVEDKIKTMLFLLRFPQEPPESEWSNIKGHTRKLDTAGRCMTEVSSCSSLPTLLLRVRREWGRQRHVAARQAALGEVPQPAAAGPVSLEDASSTEGSEAPCSQEAAVATPPQARPALCLRRTGSPQVFTQAQWVAGLPVWPERWGMTRGQVGELLRRLRRDPAWCAENSVYTLVSDFLIPWTRGRGLGYALQANQAAPQEVNLMVSHAWGENAEEFLKTVLRSTREGDVLFVCALCLYQAEDGAGPSIAEQLGSLPAQSPFRRVLGHIRRRGGEAGWCWRWQPVLSAAPAALLLIAAAACLLPPCAMGCVPALAHCAFTGAAPPAQQLRLERPAGEEQSFAIMHERFPPAGWVWRPMGPAFSVFPAVAILCCAGAAISWLLLRTSQIYRGRMIVVPNHEVDIYSRLWCVYEIFIAMRLGVRVEVAHTLAPAGRCGSQHAVCGCPQDELRIRREIETASLSYAEIDRTVSWTTSRWAAARVSLRYGFPVAMFTEPLLGLMQPASCRWRATGVLATCALTFAVGALQHWVVRRAHGRPSAASLLACSSACLAAGLPLLLWAGECFLGAGWLLTEAGAYGALHVFGSCCLPKAFRRNGRLSVLAVAAGGSICMLVPGRVRPCTTGQCYPDTVLALLMVGSVLAPVYVLWSAALRWGVQMENVYPRLREAA